VASTTLRFLPSPRGKNQILKDASCLAFHTFLSIRRLNVVQPAPQQPERLLRRRRTDGVTPV